MGNDMDEAQGEQLGFITRQLLNAKGLRPESR